MVNIQFPENAKKRNHVIRWATRWLIKSWDALNISHYGSRTEKEKKNLTHTFYFEFPKKFVTAEAIEGNKI